PVSRNRAARFHACAIEDRLGMNTSKPGAEARESRDFAEDFDDRKRDAGRRQSEFPDRRSRRSGAHAASSLDREARALRPRTYPRARCAREGFRRVRYFEVTSNVSRWTRAKFL